MKLNKRYHPPDLWDWVRSRLPASLEGKVLQIGYGVACNVYRKGQIPNLLKRAFDMEGDPVATVNDKEIVLNHPEYFSDFEDMLRNFERQTGIECTLTFWESPKDAPSA